MSDRFINFANPDLYSAPSSDDMGTTEEFRISDLDSLADEVMSVSLPISAPEAYRAFCDIEAIPRWVSVVRSVHVLERDGQGMVTSAAFLADLAQASIGYTLNYQFDHENREVTWTTPPEIVASVYGRAQFLPLGDRAALMQYQLTLDIPTAALPSWSDPYFDGHAPSAVISDFRDYIDRTIRTH